MNERIRQLAEQSGMDKILDEHAGEFGNGMFDNTPYPALEKFATLVAASEWRGLTSESIEQAIGYRLPEYAMQALLKLINTPKEDT